MITGVTQPNRGEPFAVLKRVFNLPIMKNLAIGRKAINYYIVVINTRARYLGHVYPKIKPNFKYGFLV